MKEEHVRDRHWSDALGAAGKEVYTTRRPYFTASGTQTRLDTPATREAEEKRKAALLIPAANAAIEAGDKEAGSLGLGGTAPRRSVTTSTRATAGPAAKKLTQVRAVQVSTAR